MTVAELVRQLGGDEFAARERATARLAALDVEEPPAELLRAAASLDPEIRRRASVAVRAIWDRAAGRWLARAGRLAAAGAVDRFVAATAGWSGEANDQRLWRQTCAVVQTLTQKSRVWHDEYECLTDTDRYADRVRMTFVQTDRLHRPPDSVGPEAVIAAGVNSPSGIGYSTVVSRGPVAARTMLANSVVFANGDVTVGLNCGNAALVVADGNVDIGQHADGCLVVARGNIRVGGLAMNSTFVAGGTVTIGKLPVGDARPFGPKVVEHEPNPFGWVTWFELSTVGVEAAEADGGVTIKVVTAGKPFAAAGVRKGDLVTKVGEHPVATPEEFRRRVRDAHATAAEATLTVRRDGQPVTVRVALPH